MVTFTKPCHGLITSLYSNSRLNPVLGIVRPHWGIDYGGHSDNTIIVAAGGKVRVAVNSGTGFGKHIIITHGNGWETLYAHLSVINASPGQIVQQGQKIEVKGTTGNSTGVHLRFEISKGKWSNKYVTHVNPALHIDDQDGRHLQITLNQIGYKVAMDGLYGDNSARTVLDFQKKTKLSADGVTGRVTMAALEKSVAEMEEEELKFSSSTLKNETETSLSSKSHRQVVVDAAVKVGAMRHG